MTLNAEDLAWIRDEVGEQPDDDTVEEYWAELQQRTLVAIRVLKRRRAAIAGGSTVDSFTLSGVFSVTQKGSAKDLDTQISRLEALYATETGEPVPGAAATVGRVYRADRGSLIRGAR